MPIKTVLPRDYSVTRHHWFKQWLGAVREASHYILPSSLMTLTFWRICINRPYCVYRLTLEYIMALIVVGYVISPSDDVTTWKCFWRNWLFVGHPLVTGGFIHKRPVTRALMFSLMFASNGWINSGTTDDLNAMTLMWQHCNWTRILNHRNPPNAVSYLPEFSASCGWSEGGCTWLSRCSLITIFDKSNLWTKVIILLIGRQRHKIVLCPRYSDLMKCLLFRCDQLYKFNSKSNSRIRTPTPVPTVKGAMNIKHNFD